MSTDIKNISVEVKGRFTLLTLRGDVSYGFCHDVAFGEPNIMFAAVFGSLWTAPLHQ